MITKLSGNVEDKEFRVHLVAFTGAKVTLMEAMRDGIFRKLAIHIVSYPEPAFYGLTFLISSFPNRLQKFRVFEILVS